MNNEKTLAKIGKLIDKGNITKEDIEKLFLEDAQAEETQGTETPKAEQGNEKAQAKVEPSEDGKEGKPSEQEPQAEEPKAEEVQTAQDNNVAQEPTPTPEGTAEAGSPTNPISMESLSERMDAMSRALEGMARENEALRKALKEANVLCDSTPDNGNPVGLDGSSAPSKAQDEGMSNVLAKLNRGRG